MDQRCTQSDQPGAGEASEWGEEAHPPCWLHQSRSLPWHPRKRGLLSRGKLQPVPQVLAAERAGFSSWLSS